MRRIRTRSSLTTSVLHVACVAVTGDVVLTEKEQEQLRLLLAAAETIKPKLLSLLTLGPDALDAHAYAIKARVKGYDSAVAKIIEKRERGAREYSPSKMTDVIGVRVLCLWPDDIAVILERLIRMIDEICSTGLSSFAGTSIAEVVTEVIVYKAANSPAIYDVIGKQLTAWLLDHGRASECVRVEDSPKHRPYSSVHMVVWCRAPSGGTWVRVPVEFQVRTSLEDVWSEVDHRLRYKKRSRDIEERIEKVGNQLLDQLKGQLDFAATTVTSARLLFTPAPPQPSASHARIVPDADPLVRWGAQHASEQQKTLALSLTTELDAFYAEFEPAVDRTSPVWDERLAQLASDLEAAIVSRELEPSSDRQDELTWLFASRMELAQLLLWRGRLERSEPEQNTDVIEQIGKLTERCLKTYLELINSRLFEHSALLWFRFGNALLDLKADFEQAYVYLKRAHAELATDDSLARTPLAIAIPRMFAYAAWRVQNEQYLRSVKKFGMHSAAAEHCRDAIANVLAVMRPLLSAIDEVSQTGPFWDPAAEKVRVANNLLSYAWYFGLMDARAKGVVAPRRKEFSQAVRDVVARNLIRAAYEELANEERSADTEMTTNRLHTLATASFILEDAAADRYREELSERLAGSEFGEDEISADILQMKSDLKVLKAKE